MNLVMLAVGGMHSGQLSAQFHCVVQQPEPWAQLTLTSESIAMNRLPLGEVMLSPARSPPLLL